MNNSLIQYFSCPDVYRLYILSLTTDRELKTDTTLDQLAGFVGEKVTAYNGNNKSLSFTDKLRASNEVSVITQDGISYKNGNKVTRNTYTFKEPVPTQYRRISKGLYTLDLEVKLKGYILKLFSVAEPHSHLITKSAREIESTIHVTRASIKKYNEILSSKGLLEATEDGLQLNVEALILDQPDDKANKRIAEIFEGMDKVIKSKLDHNIPLKKNEACYIAAKKDNFSKINNLYNFAMYVLTGVPYKRKDKPIFDKIHL
nr:hypothetical protein [uncultured Bacteroides sp.]